MQTGRQRERERERETLTEELISPDERLAIFLYRMRRGDYIHTVAELFGVGDSTILI